MTAPDEQRTSPTVGHDAHIVIVGDQRSMGLTTGLANVTVSLVTPDRERSARGGLVRALGPFQTGVVVVVVPPADDETVRQVARLRQERPGIRAVLVDLDTAPDRRLAALEAGFDEALPHRLGDTEIAGRLALQLTRTRMVSSHRLAVGVGVELDLQARALRRRGRFVHLRPLEFRLLEELARAPGRPLSRAWLLDRAWGAAPPAGSRTIDVHVRWLREKVERDPDQPIHILTVRGVGYQLEPRDPDALESMGPESHG